MSPSRRVPLLPVLALAAATLALFARPVSAETAAEKAAAEYQRGKDAFQTRDYAAARQSFERAYMLDPSPVLLYNLGRACEEAGEAEKAVEYFQMYLDRTAETPDREDVERRVRVMQAIIAKQRSNDPSPSETPPPAERPAPPSPAHTVRWPIGWGVLGAGVVTAGVGIAFGVASGQAEDDHKTATTGAAKRRTADDAEAAALKANVCYALGGALVATGITLLVLDAREMKSGPTAMVTREGAAFGWIGEF